MYGAMQKKRIRNAMSRRLRDKHKDRAESEAGETADHIYIAAFTKHKIK